MFFSDENLLFCNLIIEAFFSSLKQNFMHDGINALCLSHLFASLKWASMVLKVTSVGN